MTDQPKTKEQFALEKLELEVEILALEKQQLEKRQPPLSHGWEIAKTWFGLAGWVIAATSLLISVSQYKDQQQQALEQRVEEQTEEALTRIQEDPLRLALYLQSYAKEATPLLVELIHARHEEENWPFRQLRALRSIEEVGIHLTPRQLELLQEEARRGWTALEGWIGTEPRNRPEPAMRAMDEVVYQIYKLVGTDDAVDLDRKWRSYVDNGRLDGVPGFPS